MKESPSAISRTTLEGVLLTLTPLSAILPFLGRSGQLPALWQQAAAVLAGGGCFFCALNLYRRHLLGRLLGAGAVLCGFAAALPYLEASPFVALTALLSLIFALGSLLDFNVSRGPARRNLRERRQHRARGAVSTLPLVVLITALPHTSIKLIPFYVQSAAALITLVLFLHWSLTIVSRRRIALAGIGLILLALGFFRFSAGGQACLILMFSCLGMLTIPGRQPLLDSENQAWEFLLNHPARIMFTSFFALCLAGTLLLSLGGASSGIKLIDAAFTSVSAVCVTGLIVLDTPTTFTHLGQFFILLLIQLGGLGIMSITTVALRIIGHRFSLKHERLLTSLTDTSHLELRQALATIVKFTLIAEVLGAIALTTMFSLTGEALGSALWRGIFTSVSAFCNAGFALQSDSLIGYQQNPLILQTVAGLIIIGGLAPATSLMIPDWLRGRPIPPAARIALNVSLFLLLSGTLLILVREWNGVLANLSLTDKFHNAWFQAATLRTAGFNSVAISNISAPTFLLMIIFMFIGGSPGGTAGGIKTTTIGILAMTFWANITNRNHVILRNRRLDAGTINRAITVFFAGLIIWFLVVLMLEVTQPIAARDLIFEAFSALGTVGLSTGATGQLDEIGKVIIIAAMFIGRIGPLTLFMLISEEQPGGESKYPLVKISIT